MFPPLLRTRIYLRTWLIPITWLIARSLWVETQIPFVFPLMLLASQPQDDHSPLHNLTHIPEGKKVSPEAAVPFGSNVSFSLIGQISATGSLYLKGILGKVVLLTRAYCHHAISIINPETPPKTANIIVLLLKKIEKIGILKRQWSVWQHAALQADTTVSVS